MAKELLNGGFEIHFLITPNKLENDIDDILLGSIKDLYTICKNKEELLKEIENLCIKGFNYIYPLFPDNMIIEISEINKKFEMKGIKPFSANQINNKSKYYKIWNNLQIPCPSVYYESEYLKELTNINFEIKFPCIVKPSQGFCSLGVQIIEDEKSLFDFFRDTDKKHHNFQESHNSKFKGLQYLSLGGNYLIQQYIKGKLISVSGIVKNNKIHIDFIYEIESDSYPFAAETGFLYPTSLDSIELRKKIENNIKKFFDHIDLTDSPFMFDIIVDQNNNLYFIDFAARTSAVSYRLFLYSGEKNYSLKLIKKILNDEDYTIQLKPCILRTLPLKPGMLEKIIFPNEDLADKIDYPKSKKIIMLRNDFSINNNGSVLISGSTVQEAEEKWKKLISSMVVKYQS